MFINAGGEGVAWLKSSAIALRGIAATMIYSLLSECYLMSNFCESEASSRAGLKELRGTSSLEAHSRPALKNQSM